MRYSFGMPIFLPRRSLDKPGFPLRHVELERGRILGIEAAIASSMIAQSRTSRAIGPAWSSDEAKATTPQREQRP